MRAGRATEADRLRGLARRRRRRSSSRSMMPSRRRRATTSTVEVPGLPRGHRARGRPDRGGRAHPGLRPHRVDAARRCASPAGMPEAVRVPRPRPRLAACGPGSARCGSFPFASEADLALTGDTDAIRVTNPLQCGRAVAADAAHAGPAQGGPAQRLPAGARSRPLFEVGTVFRMVDGPARGAAEGGLRARRARPRARGRRRREFDVFDAKGVVEALMAELGIDVDAGRARAGRSVPSRAVGVRPGRRRSAVGVVGEIHPRVAESLDVAGRDRGRPSSR